MHSHINKIYKALFVFALTLFSLNSYAESSKEFGDYVIHSEATLSQQKLPNNTA